VACEALAPEQSQCVLVAYLTARKGPEQVFIVEFLVAVTRALWVTTERVLVSVQWLVLHDDGMDDPGQMKVVLHDRILSSECLLCIETLGKNSLETHWLPTSASLFELAELPQDNLFAGNLANLEPAVQFSQQIGLDGGLDFGLETRNRGTDGVLLAGQLGLAVCCCCNLSSDGDQAVQVNEQESDHEKCPFVWRE
jgi:hypothetical protein